MIIKKIPYLLSAVLLVLTSCSSDDYDSSQPNPSIENPGPALPDPSDEKPDPPQSSSILPQKKIYIAGEGFTSTWDILYDGNKIVSMANNGGSSIKYTYTGDLITKVEEIQKDPNHYFATEYVYVDGQLSASIQKYDVAPSRYYKTKYTHNSDGTISYATFKVDVVTGVEERNGLYGKYTIENGNLVKNQRSHTDFDSRVTTETYEYDNENNPFINVLGFNLLLDNPAVNNLNRRTTSTGTGYEISASNLLYSNKYDANNFLTEQITVHRTGDWSYIETIQYIY